MAAGEGMGSASQVGGEEMGVATLAFESQHLILLLPGTGTQLHLWAAALSSLGLPLIDTPWKQGMWSQE